MYAKTGQSAYAQVSLESQVAGATPHQLITLLMDGAISAMMRAKIYFESGNIAKRGEMISRAINIIDNGLRASLNHEVGGAVTEEMESLYEYVSRNLLLLNLQKQPEQLPHLIEIMTTLSTTWKEIEPTRKPGHYG
ncbi:flagellar export chaperone FliS [Cedecea sp.]|jgi:flagellar biosynthetic protein FliS|uniref:flagellar export chaperone FliS n=1 Tax=Cedecea sp. TaxID=1970739 RepID=UPI0012AEA49C|nr:flagellar export chaperone FliS [Enterobacteriaceae bacterium RIT693]